MASTHRGKHAKRPERVNRASGLAFAVGLGMAVASGHGVASASTGEGQPSGSTDSDTGSKSTTTDSTNTSTKTPTKPSTKTPGKKGSSTHSGSTTKTTKTTETAKTTKTTKTTKNPSTKPGIQTTPAADPAAPETAHAAVEMATPAAKTMVMSAASTTTSPGLPTITLPSYPTVPGASATKVALAVFVVLGRAFESAISGPVPNPIAIPLYMLAIAAYQRLTEVALNHVPVAGTPSTPLQVPVTGTIIGDIGTATDPDGDPLNYTVTTQPKNGTVALVGTAYTYTPSAVELTNGGSDSFTVTIDDLQGAADHFYAPNGHTTTETINLTVAGTGIVVPPVVTATQGPRDSIGVVHGGFTVVNPPGTTGNTFSLANGNSPGATATSAFSSLGGIVSLNATTGNWTYIPAVSGNLLGIPTHTDSFVVTVDNGQSSVQDTVTVGADLETAVTATSTNQTNGAYSGGLNIPPADGGLLTYSVGTPPSSKGTVVVNADGSFTYTPTAAARHAAAATNATTAAKTDSFTIVGTDANGRQITVATVPVTISATNTAPTASYSVTNPGSNGQVTGIIMASDADNDTLSYGATSTTSSKGGAVTVNAATGTFSYQPTAGAMHAASAENATTADKQDTFTVTVDDGHGGDTSVPVTVSIKPQNTAPTVSYGTPLKVTGVATYTPTYTDVDGDSVSYTVTTAPTHGTVLVNLSVLGVTTLVYTANNLLLPSHDSFTVTVDDGHGGTAVTTLNPY